MTPNYEPISWRHSNVRAQRAILNARPILQAMHRIIERTYTAHGKIHFRHITNNNNKHIKKKVLKHYTVKCVHFHTLKKKNIPNQYLLKYAGVCF